MRPSHKLHGERRVVTILSCDVTGSTAMAEQLDPEIWAEIMDDAFGLLIHPIQRYRGNVARLMGEAVLGFSARPPHTKMIRFYASKLVQKILELTNRESTL